MNHSRVRWVYMILGLAGAAALLTAYFLGDARWSPPLALAALAVCATAYAVMEWRPATRSMSRVGWLLALGSLALWGGSAALLLTQG